MACCDCDDGTESENARLLMTVVMTGIVAIATWELWGRHMAPLVYGHELSAASFIQALFGINNKLTAEAVYFITAIPFVSLLYLFVWQPLLSTTLFAKHWVLLGTSYGVALFVIAKALIFFITTIPSHETLFIPTDSGWLIGALAAGFMTAGFVRLRDLGRQII